MISTKSYKWYFENGCEIVPLKQFSNEVTKYSLTLLDIQADFSDVFKEKKETKVETAENVTGLMSVGGGLFYKKRDELTHKDASAVIREKYVMEVDQLWAYIRWHYNFEDEIKIQKNLVSDFTKIRKVPKLHVSTHIIEGAINDMGTNENICILKYTTFGHFADTYKNELEDLKKKSKMYNYCNYVYEVCDVADKSLLFSNSPVINTTVKNILSITKSGKKREDFNTTTEEEEAEYSTEDEIWQVYISNRIESINDQWLLVCINDKLKEIIENSGDIYFKIFNKYIKEYNEYVHSHDYNADKTGRMDEFNSSFSNESTSTASTLNTQFHQTGKNLKGYEKYKVNLIFSENKDINYVIYKLCIKLGRMNDVVLCTKHKSYNIMMNDIDGTLAICFKPFLSKYFQNTKYENRSNVLSNGIIQNSSIDGSEVKGNENIRRKIEIGNKNINENNADEKGKGENDDDDDDLIKTISIMGLCKEKMLLFEKATIFSNVDLLYSYFLLVHTDALNVNDVEGGNGNTTKSVENVDSAINNNNINNNINSSNSSIDNGLDSDGIIYLSRKALFENIQFSNEEISSYLLHLQKYSNSNLLYIKNKGFRYMKNETLYEFLIKLLELISLHDHLYEEQKVEKISVGNPLFQKYQEDLYRVQKKRYGITFRNLFKIITDNINEFQFLQWNKLPIEPYVVLQMCLKCCDIENKHFEYFSLYYNYYFFYEYLNKESEDLCFEDILEKYLSFLHKDHQIDETIIYFNLYKLHKLTALNILRTSGRVDVYSDKLFTFDIKMETYVKYIDGVFKSLNSNLMDKIITYFIKNYQFFLDYGYDRKGTKGGKEMGVMNSGINKFNGKDENEKKSFTDNNNNNNNNNDEDDINLEMDRYRNRVFFRNNVILNVNNINHICNDEYMFQYFIVVKYYYHDNSFGLLEMKLKKFIKTAEEDFIVAHQKAVEYDIDKKFKINWQKLRSNYCLNYKIYKYQTIPFPHIRLNHNYNDLLNTVYSPLSIHFSIFHENVIYNKKQNSFQLIPSFLLKDYLRSCLTTLYTLKNSYYAQELYPFLNPLLYNKDLIGTIAVPPLRHCRTKLIERENEKNVEFIEMDSIITSTLNNDMKRYKGTNLNTRKKIEKLCKLYNCNLPVNNFNY